jgi:hypothetical protein
MGQDSEKPNHLDPRLYQIASLGTLLLYGLLWLHFDVSIPQIAVTLSIATGSVLNFAPRDETGKSPHAARPFAERPPEREPEWMPRSADASACSFSPSAPITLRIVSKPMLRSSERALYKLSYESPPS